MALNVTCDECKQPFMLDSQPVYELRPCMPESLKPLHDVGSHLHSGCLLSYVQRVYFRRQNEILSTDVPTPSPEA